MPARKKDHSRILPPPTPADPWPAYKHGGGWRFVTVLPDGTRVPSDTFATRALAAKARQKDQGVIDGKTNVTVEQGMGAYELYLRSEEDEGPKCDSTIKQALIRLRLILVDRDELLAAMTPARCLDLYTNLRTRINPRTAKPYAVNTHRNTLDEAGRFLRWCVTQRYLTADGFAAVKGWGRKRKRKTQPKIDEVRLFLAEAHRLAYAGEDGAVAALMALTMGLRAGEIARRLVCDVDANASLLHVTAIMNKEGVITWKPKTDGSEGIERVPPPLRDYLRQVVRGRAPAAPLWPPRPPAPSRSRNWPRIWVARICRAAGIPVYTAHDMRRAFGTASILGGLAEAQERTRKELRHKSFDISRGHYVTEEAITEVAQDAAAKTWGERDVN